MQVVHSRMENEINWDKADRQSSAVKWLTQIADI